MTDTREQVAAIARLAGLGVTAAEVKALLAETPADEIKSRQGPGGKSLDYIDARYVMDVLDQKIGPENWQRDHRMTESGKVSCGIGINVDGNWIWKWDGAGETDIEGEKGSFSDSFKRAAVSWGIARDLYDSGRSTSAPVSRPAEQRETRNVVPFDPNSNERHDRQGDADGICPDHGQPWVLKPGGTSKSTGKPYDPFYACPFRPQRGEKFCQQKPSKAWLAAHEVA
jgi:hypothetical protein